MANVAVIEAALRLDGKQWDRTIARAKKGFETLITDSRALSAAAGTLLLGVGVGLASLASELKSAGDEAIQLKKTLDTTFDGAELDKLTEKIRVLGATPPFSEEQFTKAAKQLETFGKDVESNLERIGNVAAQTGGSFESIAESFATFGIKAEASNRLLEIANISPKRLAEYGAVLDATGKKLDFTGENAAKAQQALEKLADSEFKGAMDQAVTATDQLKGSLLLLKQDAGIALAEFADSAAGAVLPLVEGLRDLPAPAKAATGTLVALGGAAALGAAGLIAIGLAAGPMTAALTGGLTVVGTLAAAIKTKLVAGLLAAQLQAGVMGTTLGGLGVALGGIGLIAGSTGAALYYLQKIEKENTESAKALLEVELRRIKAQKDLPGLIGKTAEELKKSGKTARDAAEGLIALQEQLERARKAGNEALVGRIIDRIKELKAVKEELAKLEASGREEERAKAEFNSAEAVEKRRKAAEAAAEDAKKAREKALQEELFAIELRQAQEEISEREALQLRAQALEKFRADESEKRSLLLETARFEAQAAKEAASKSSSSAEAGRKQKLQDELDRIDLLRTRRQISANEELKLLQNVLATFKTTEQEKRALIKETAQLEAEIAEESAAKVKEANEKKFEAFKENVEKAKKEAEDLQRAQSEAGQLRFDELDKQIEALTKQTIDTGKNNTSAISQAFQEQLNIQLEQIRLEGEREAAATTSAEARAQIEKNTQAKIRAEVQETAEEQKSVFKEIQDAHKEMQDTISGATSFGNVYGIEDLAKNLELEKATTSRLRGVELNSIAAQDQQMRAIMAQLPEATAIKYATSDNKAANAVPVDVKVDVNVKGNVPAEAVVSTSVDGRQSSITRDARGMRGRLGMA